MAITELVIPSLKQDEETRQKFEADVIPQFQTTIGPAPGLKDVFFGRITSEDNVNVEKDVKYALGLEWETTQNFVDFFTGDTFKDFAASAIKPLATAPAKPEIYNTEESPAAVFSSAITEVYRIEYEGEAQLNLAKEVWGAFVGAVKEIERDTPSLDGVSINFEEKVHLGIVGWKGFEERKHVLQNVAAKGRQANLDAVEGVSSFIAAFGHQ